MNLEHSSGRFLACRKLIRTSIAQKSSHLTVKADKLRRPKCPGILSPVLCRFSGTADILHENYPETHGKLRSGNLSLLRTSSFSILHYCLFFCNSIFSNLHYKSKIFTICTSDSASKSPFPIRSSEINKKYTPKVRRSESESKPRVAKLQRKITSPNQSAKQRHIQSTPRQSNSYHAEKHARCKKYVSAKTTRRDDQFSALYYIINSSYAL